MARRRRSSSLKLLTFLVLLAVAGYRAWQGEWPLQEVRSKDAPKSVAKVFQVLPDARLEDGRNNDGDSFTMSAGGEIYEFRLYFADCAEKRRHSYNADRLRDQGRYFGGLTESETTTLGLRAKERTEKWLRSQRFTVYTKWQPVYDSGRYYAFVVFADGEELSEKLVKEGLARIHTTGTNLPDGRSREAFEAHLRELERRARAAGRGGWGVR